MNEGRDKLIKLLRWYLGDIDYFWAAEPHKSGYVHYHLAVFADVSNDCRYWTHEHGIDWFRGDVKLEDKLRDLWSKKYQIGSHTYGLDFSRKEDILKNSDDAVLHLKNYLTKYLSKGFLIGEWTPGILIFNAVAWDTGFRLYGASKRIREVMNCEPEKNRDVVWLETKLREPAPVEEGEDPKDEIERVIWSRQYIPDWIDSEIWLDRGGGLVEPTFIFTGEWGRLLKPAWTERVYDYKTTLRQRDDDYKLG